MVDESKVEVNYDIVIAGMGGQGSILASYLLAEAALIDKLPVLSTGDYGMAQRGGMVTTHLRLGSSARSQKIPVGCADLMIGCAPSEALRNIGFLHEGAAVVLDTLVHIPIPVYIDKKLTYPTFDEIKARFDTSFEKVYAIDASTIAQEFGNPRIMNTVLLGASLALGTIPISRAAMMEALESKLRADLVQINIDAFERGEEEMIKLL
ncbi:MAG: indolepyruvate oxidoreductase subunit beta [Thermoplasmata archaeon]|nr:MAG: indolepyruvate oxidoreductase subunit beta [Thermoplasmata archaeon]